ncbi:hypothetical protein GEMRC1_003166 [Eukaryota sp. GEM-RC1]
MGKRKFFEGVFALFVSDPSNSSLKSLANHFLSQCKDPLMVDLFSSTGLECSSQQKDEELIYLLESDSCVESLSFTFPRFSFRNMMLQEMAKTDIKSSLLQLPPMVVRTDEDGNSIDSLGCMVAPEEEIVEDHDDVSDSDDEPVIKVELNMIEEVESHNDEDFALDSFVSPVPLRRSISTTPVVAAGSFLKPVFSLLEKGQFIESKSLLKRGLLDELYEDDDVSLVGGYLTVLNILISLKPLDPQFLERSIYSTIPDILPKHRCVLLSIAGRKLSSICPSLARDLLRTAVILANQTNNSSVEKKCQGLIEELSQVDSTSSFSVNCPQCDDPLLFDSDHFAFCPQCQDSVQVSITGSCIVLSDNASSCDRCGAYFEGSVDRSFVVDQLEIFCNFVYLVYFLIVIYLLSFD